MVRSARSNPVGSHVPVGRGLVIGALPLAESLGAETIQIFVGNPRGWRLSPGDPATDEEFRAATEAMPVYVHAPYLVNLGSPTPATYEKSLAVVEHNLRRAARIGARGVVVHTGSSVAEGELDAALRQVHEGMLPLLDFAADLGVPILLEPTAGQGRSLCAGVEDLEQYLGALDRHPSAGICLDTCHVFAAGAPLDESGGMASTLDALVRIAGPGRLGLIHANDSLDVRGSMRDRHEKIGQGHIGVDAFADLFTHPATAGVPIVLETPRSASEGDPDLPLLKKLRAYSVPS